MLEGRNYDQKKNLVKDITDVTVKNLKVDPDLVEVFLHETSKEHYGKSGKLASD
tara:strand:+ start:123 stop:284 length:162 start_codon:yes stop_codon:yes gene_type:complete